MGRVVSTLGRCVGRSSGCGSSCSASPASSVHRCRRCCPAAAGTCPGSESDTVNIALRHGFVARGETNITVVVHDQWYASNQPGFEKRAARIIDEVAATKRARGHQPARVCVDLR